MELNTQTAHELLGQVKNKKASAEKILKSLKAQIKKTESKIKAYVDIPVDLAPPGALPVAIKDNICTESQPTTCASKILAGFHPPYDATVVKKIKDAGMFVWGKTNMDEFAFGSSTENSCYGISKNPWDLKRVSGGSSGGSAAAVGSSEAIWALGSDTGGSIRQPASFCGVVGLKPTYGRVSRYGLIAFASSLDQIGPITKDVTDSALLLNIIAGYDSCDSTSVDIPKPDYTHSLTKNVNGLRIGLPKEYFAQALDTEVDAALKQAIKLLEKLGAKFKQVDLPHTDFAIATYYVIATAEASSNLARFDGVQYGFRKSLKDQGLIDMYKATREEGFGLESKRRIMLGTYVLSHGYYEAYYIRAQKVRALIKEDFDKVFNECDCIITPTSPTPAFKIGEKAQDPLSMYLSDIYTVSVNLAGIPAISIPCGFTKNNLPIGMQIIAKPFAEETIFKAAYTYEQSTDWHKERPKL